MEVLIYQVLGKLSRYSNVSYEIDGFIEKNVKLSSEALCSFYAREGYNPQIVYVCPNSLYSGQETQEYLTNQVLLRKSFREEISSVSVRDFDILIINAIGNYRIGGEKVSFKNTPGNIAVQIFLDMLERTKKHNGKMKVIVDISTGHNVYIAPMLEALRGIIVYNKLRNGIRENKIGAAYAVSEPVIGPDSEPSRRIFINEYDVKAFFTLPVKLQDLNNLHKLEYYVECSPKIKEKIHHETEDKIKRLRTLLENLVKAFNSIRYNVPLAFYSGLIDLVQDIDVLEKELAEFFLKQVKPVFNGGTVIATSLDWRNLFNLFYSLAIFKWISDEMSSLRGRDRASVTELKEKFTQIYGKLDLLLNRRFLERDLGEIESKRDMIPSEWTCLKNLFQEGGREGPPSISDPKRNFFAHSGLERTIVEVRKCGKEIELRYMQGQLDTISKWLFKPED